MYLLTDSSKSNKKYMVTLPNGKKVHFGDSNYEDFTTHHDINRKMKYIKRHMKNENWTKTGIDTPGFWSRWILWNKKDFLKSIKDTCDRFNINIKYDVSL